MMVFQASKILRHGRGSSIVASPLRPSLSTLSPQRRRLKGSGKVWGGCLGAENFCLALAPPSPTPAKARDEDQHPGSRL